MKICFSGVLEYKMNKKLTHGEIAIVVIIGIILFIGIPVAIALWNQAEIQKMLDRGCTPTSSNWMGPATWSCPVK
jgi:hypothetical protein